MKLRDRLKNAYRAFRLPAALAVAISEPQGVAGRNLANEGVDWSVFVTTGPAQTRLIFLGDGAMISTGNNLLALKIQFMDENGFGEEEMFRERQRYLFGLLSGDMEDVVRLKRFLESGTPREVFDA